MVVWGGGADDGGGGCGPDEPPPDAPVPGGTEVAADAIWRFDSAFLITERCPWWW